MNWEQDLAGEKPELEQALRHFKASVDAWSDAAYHQPRTAAKSAVRHSWRMATGWALGCLLAVGSLAGAGHEIYHRQELAKIAERSLDAEKDCEALKNLTEIGNMKFTQARAAARGIKARALRGRKRMAESENPRHLASAA